MKFPVPPRRTTDEREGVSAEGDPVIRPRAGAGITIIVVQDLFVIAQPLKGQSYYVRIGLLRHHRECCECRPSEKRLSKGRCH